MVEPVSSGQGRFCPALAGDQVRRRWAIAGIAVGMAAGVFAVAVAAIVCQGIPRPVSRGARRALAKEVLSLRAPGVAPSFLARYADAFAFSYLRAGWRKVPRTCLVARKSAFTMGRYVDGRLRERYAICIGRDDGSAKKTPDDRITPEGIFWISWKNANPAGPWGMNGRGYGSRLLSLGGPGSAGGFVPRWEIAIHGVPPGAEWTIGRKRSLGCIRLHNREMIELFDRVKTGDLVLICP